MGLFQFNSALVKSLKKKSMQRPTY